MSFGTKITFPDPEDEGGDDGDEGGIREPKFLGLYEGDWQHMVTQLVINYPFVFAIVLAAYLLKS